MGKQSAGLLMYRQRTTDDGDLLELFLAHPGGPYFTRKDEGWWSIPKGEPEPGENLKQCAVREFNEETGLNVEPRKLIELGYVDQKAGKRIFAWAFEGDWEQGRALACNTFEIEWPPRSGIRASFPEIDRAEFFAEGAALRKINQAQRNFILRLKTALLANQNR